MTSVSILIPFRDRGVDPRRAANLDVVMAWWYAHGFEPRVVDDGLEGDAPFNRHRAYNRAVERYPADVYVFTEADMLIHPDQIRLAIRLAQRRPGLVVPFTQYRYLSDEVTGVVRDNYHDLAVPNLSSWWERSPYDSFSIFQIEPESIMDNGRSIGAINIVSRETLEITGGFTEATRGNWYDDNIIEEAFAFLTGNKTAFVPGPAVHMYHLPGHATRGGNNSRLTYQDRQATQHNKALLHLMRRDIRQRNHEAVRAFMQYRTR